MKKIRKIKNQNLILRKWVMLNNNLEREMKNMLVKWLIIRNQKKSQPNWREKK